jgi:GNAT superfamily N-acetyltransferase
MAATADVRTLNETDPETISVAFEEVGIRKSAGQYRRYLAEQASGHRSCLVATVDTQFAGYVTVNWMPEYAAFAESKIPEIQDLNVLPEFRRRGIATLLLDRAEQEISRTRDIAGISVGLHPGYNEAQRLYVKRGYVPDGRGASYRYQGVKEGMQVLLDDNFLLHFTKRLVRS